jgi:hypothetical protein
LGRRKTAAEAKNAFIISAETGAFRLGPAAAAMLVHASDEATQISALLPALEKNQELPAVYEVCPADIYKSKMTLFSLLRTDEWPDLDACEADLKYCHDACVHGKNGEACFSLARLLQDNGAPAADRHYEPLFALACAIGKPAGCTNRGGGIRNGGYENDPSGKWTEEARGLCLRRSFKTACDGDDAWGCAMHGQALFLGEGGPEDWGLAKAAFEKTCTLDPDFDSCGFAKSYMEDMKALGAPQ